MLRKRKHGLRYEVLPGLGVLTITASGQRQVVDDHRCGAIDHHALNYILNIIKYIFWTSHN